MASPDLFTNPGVSIEDEPQTKKPKFDNDIQHSEELNSENYSELITFPTSDIEDHMNDNSTIEQEEESQPSPKVQNVGIESKDDEPSDDLPNPEADIDESEEASKLPPSTTEESVVENSDSEDEKNEKESKSETASEVEVVQVKAVPHKKKSLHRKDIRKIMNVDQLDEETLAAQREEAERLQRMLQKQQMAKQAQSSSASLLPISIEDVMRKMAGNGVTLSLSDIYNDLDDFSAPIDLRETEDKVKAKEEKEIKPEIKVEPEIFTISSDEEEPAATQIVHKTPTGPTVIEHNFCKSSGGVVYAGNSTNIITLDDEESSVPPKLKTEESSDDDCVVISPPPSDQDDLTEGKDEDANNRPDEFGRVLVNVGHPDDEPDIFLPPKIAEAMKPHQIGGVRFLYDNVVESLDRFEQSAGFGCILAHSMGLGKTIQAAAFCEVFLRCTSARTVLVIVPINTVQNWSHEFNQWLSTEVNTSSTGVPSYSKRKAFQAKKESSPDNIDSTNSSTLSVQNVDEQELDATVKEKPEEKPKKLNLFVLNETIKTLAGREKIISDWGKEGGVLLIGYEMYRMLALKKLKKNSKKKQSMEMYSHFELTDEQDELLDKIHTSLVRPGPDLVICDEGHRIKNSGASISQALKAIRTRRRVVLTGYPLQNNLMEYWCMVDFIRPNYLGSKAEFSNMFERPISNGQCADSTPQDKRLMQFRSHVLHTLLQGFVQRQSHIVLKRALPPKEEYVFLVKMSPIQYQLYKEYISYIQLQVDMGYSTPNPIKAFAVCSKLWNHPDVLYKVIKKKQSVLLDDLELEDLASEVKKLKKTAKSTSYATSSYQDNQSPSNDDNMFNGRECFFTGETSESCRREAKTGQDKLLSLEWASSSFINYTPGVLENGTKFQLLFVIIEETITVGDKLLVFSQSLLTLDLMETFLHSKFGWKKGHEYFRLDGSTQGLEREKLINEFNSHNAIHVFLVSTKAGSLGVNLIGANRVVVFDASWNPCHDCQAVCRIYRYGQKKPCQIYRFVTDFTLEKQIYDRQIHKGGMANRVVDEMNPDSHFNSRELLSTLLLEIHELEKSQNTIVEHDINNYSDTVMCNLLTKVGDRITRRPFEHESLLIDRKDKKLSASERRLAIRNYEIEKKAAANYANGTCVGPGRPPGSTSSGGIIYPMLGKPFPDNSSWNTSRASPSYHQNYSFGGVGEIDILPKPVASVRPYQRDMFDRNSVSMVPNTRATGSSLNWPAVIEELRRKGVLTTQLIVLKKHYILPNPTGGRDTYLKPGDTLELIRARKCSYIRLSNGQFMAMRRGSRGYAYLDTIPFSQYLSSDQLEIFLSSFLRAVTSASMLPQDPYQSPLMYNSSSSSNSGRHVSSSSRSHSHNGNGVHHNTTNHRYNFSNPEPPVSFPLPPTLPYGPFSNLQNVQMSNPISNSGGDVTIYRRDHHEKPKRLHGDLIPDMELIKLSSSDHSQKSKNNQESTPMAAHLSSTIQPARINLTDQISISANNAHFPSSSTSRPFPISVGVSSPSFSIQPQKLRTSSNNFTDWRGSESSRSYSSAMQNIQSHNAVKPNHTHNAKHTSSFAERNHLDLSRLQTNDTIPELVHNNSKPLHLSTATPHNSGTIVESDNISRNANLSPQKDSRNLSGYYDEIEKGLDLSDYSFGNIHDGSSGSQNSLRQYYSEVLSSSMNSLNSNNTGDSVPIYSVSQNM